MRQARPSSLSIICFSFKQLQNICVGGDSLRGVGHAEGRQVPVGEGEQRHDGGEGAVVTEEDAEFGVGDVAHHE